MTANQLAPRVIGNRLGIRPGSFAVRLHQGVPKTTRDGVVLPADVYRPRQVRRTPTILVRLLYAPSATNRLLSGLFGRLWDGEETLLVISSDLSHYRDYITAQQRDAVTAAAIAALAPEGLDGEAACGYLPIAGLLDAARRHRLRATLLDLRNSGDTAGARDEVVGYASFAFA